MSVVKHGYAIRVKGKQPKEYTRWLNMMHRCYKPYCPEYANYGDRGIFVCERWHKFSNFLQDMGEAPPGRSLDRINNDGPYCPENCRWATSDEQHRNRRVTVFLEHEGISKTINEWSVKLGIKPITLYFRHRRGWSVDRILSQPCASQGAGKQAR